MSVDKWEYLGPYLKIEIPREKVFEDQDPKCCGRIQSSAKFCRDCGKPLIVTQIEVERDAVNQGEISDAINAELLRLRDSSGEGRDGFDYWQPNGTPGTWKLPNHNKGGAYEVTAADIERTTKAFRVLFHTEIIQIEDAYGCQGEIKFGLLVWSS